MKTSYVEISKEENILSWTFKIWSRRNRILKTAKFNACPRCRTPQVQLINSASLAKWKCRECRHKWYWEPLLLIRSN